MYQITKAKKLADKIYLMVVKAPRISANCKPGEFVIVKPSGTVHYCKGRQGR